MVSGIEMETPAFGKIVPPQGDDLGRLLGDVTPVRTSESATAIVENLPE
jgi:hypothetical protein